MHRGYRRTTDAPLPSRHVDSEGLRDPWHRAIHEGRLLEIYFHRVKSRQAAAFETFVRDMTDYRDFVKTFAELFED